MSASLTAQSDALAVHVATSLHENNSVQTPGSVAYAVVVVAVVDAAAADAVVVVASGA